MKVVRVETAPLEPAFRGAGYRMSHSFQTRLHHRLVRLTLEDGRQGHGAPADPMLGSIDLTEALDTPRDLIAHPARGRVGPVAGPGLGDLPAGLFADRRMA